MRPTSRVVALIAFAVLAPAGSAPADAPDPAKLAAWKALADEWFSAGNKPFKEAPADFGSHPDFWGGPNSPARDAIADRAAALPPLPPEAVAPLAEHCFARAAKELPQLEKKTPAWFFDEQRRRGLYLAQPPKKGAGLFIVLAEADEKSATAAKTHAAWTSAVPEGSGVLTTEVGLVENVSWNDWSEERCALRLLDAARRTWDFDTNRVGIAGHGVGGRAAWVFGGQNADLFAGLASLSGGPTMQMAAGASDAKGAVRADYLGVKPAILANLAHTGVWFSHAEDDAVRPVFADDIAAELLAKLRALRPEAFVFSYDRTKTGGHGGAGKGLKPAAAWLASQTRDAYPKEIAWETQRPSQRRFGWLTIPNQFIDWARYEARVLPGNRIDVHAMVKPAGARKQSGVPPLTILLSPKLVDFDAPLVVESNGRKLFEGLPPRTLWALLTSIGERGDRNQWFEGHVTVQIPPEPWREAWDAAK